MARVQLCGCHGFCSWANSKLEIFALLLCAPMIAMILKSHTTGAGSPREKCWRDALSDAIICTLYTGFPMSKKLSTKQKYIVCSRQLPNLQHH